MKSQLFAFLCLLHSGAFVSNAEIPVCVAILQCAGDGSVLPVCRNELCEQEHQPQGARLILRKTCGPRNINHEAEVEQLTKTSEISSQNFMDLTFLLLDRNKLDINQEYLRITFDSSTLNTEKYSGIRLRSAYLQEVEDLETLKSKALRLSN